jgi:DNA primase
MDIQKFIKSIDNSLYDEYVREKLMADPAKAKKQQENNELTEFVKKMQTPSFQANTPLKKLKKVSVLQVEHPVKKYIQNRKIPSEFHYKLFLTTGFKKWVNSFIPEKFESEENDEPRLIIPMLDKDNNMFGFQGRSFKKNSLLRYITIMFDESKPKLFGLDKVVDNYLVRVVEGPIDSMFLPNCIASCGGDIIVDLPYVSKNKENFVIIYDNEPRNPDTIRKMEKAVDAGYKICIWPDNLTYKDINDMVLGGLDTNKITKIIDDNTFKGLEAKARLQMWKKV